MKVLYILGGIPHYFDTLLKKQQKKGVEIVVVIPQEAKTIGKGVKLVEGNSYKTILTQEKKMLYGKYAFPKLPEILKEEKPDIVIMGWPYFLQLFFQPKLYRVIKANKIRLVIREIPFQTPPYNKIKSYFKENPLYNEDMICKSKGLRFYLNQWILMYIRKYAYKKATATLNYTTIAYDILPSYGILKDNIFVTYNSSDTESLLKDRNHVKSIANILPPNKFRLLHIGRLVKWKRVDLLIDAVKKIVHLFPTMQLVIIGTGPEEENLKKQVNDLKLDDHVLFVGGVYDSKELGAYMNESSVFVLAGMGGLAINDAMTYGLPIVCSVCDGTEYDLVTEGKNGLFFKNGDVDSLSDIITKLFLSPDLCQSLGKESERIIKEKINIDTVCDRYIDAFEMIMKKSS